MDLSLSVLTSWCSRVFLHQVQLLFPIIHLHFIRDTYLRHIHLQGPFWSNLRFRHSNGMAPGMFACRSVCQSGGCSVHFTLRCLIRKNCSDFFQWLMWFWAKSLIGCWIDRRDVWYYILLVLSSGGDGITSSDFSSTANIRSTFWTPC